MVQNVTPIVKRPRGRPSKYGFGTIAEGEERFVKTKKGKTVKETKDAKKNAQTAASDYADYHPEYVFRTWSVPGGIMVKREKSIKKRR